MDFDIRYYPVLQSTNETLSAMIISGGADEGLIIQAGKQTRGKGHGGNTWWSEADKNLLFSILLKPGFLSPQGQFDLSRVFCLALQNLLQEHCRFSAIKWPNDLYAGNQKIAGILIENSLQGNRIIYSIAGVGLNVNQTVFDPAIPSPTSLSIEKGCHFDIPYIFRELLKHIENWYEKLREGKIDEIRQSYLGHLYRRGVWADYMDERGPLRGKILDVLPGGELVLQTEEGAERKYGFREIAYRR